jgi:hypothetical protein
MNIFLPKPVDELREEGERTERLILERHVSRFQPSRVKGATEKFRLPFYDYKETRSLLKESDRAKCVSFVTRRCTNRLTH